MANYYVGQIFDNDYPSEAADWAEENGYYIKTLEPVEGVEKFMISEQDQETSQDRKEAFLKDFFKVSLGELGNGYYRKKPKGYQSAVESINTAQIICSKMHGLPAGTLIFYQQPNFNDPAQCTEEWLEAHQIIMPALDVEHFDDLYISFIQSWNTQEHETHE